MEAFDANEYVHINTGDTGVVEETVITDGVLEDSGDISDLLGFLDNDSEVRAEDSRSPTEVRNRLDELLQTILPQCEESSLSCDKRNSAKQFLEVYNPTSMCQESFNSKCRIILLFEEEDLFIRLLEGSTLVHNVCVGSLMACDTNTRIRRITSEFSSFIILLRDSEKSSSCPGAFYEDELEWKKMSIPTSQSKAYLIEKEAKRYLYRSRQCPMTLKGSACNPCSLLKECVFLNPIKDNIEVKREAEDSSDRLETVDEMNHNYFGSGDLSFSDTGDSSIVNRLDTENSLKPKFSTKKEFSKTPTYKSLVIEALLSSPTKKLRLEGIVAYLCQKYPNLAVNQKKLENGVRCNLSIHKLFRRLGQPRVKNSYWEMDSIEYRKILDEEKQKEEEAKSFIDQRCQVALKQWNNLKSQQRHQNRAVRVEFMQTQELRNAESFLVTDGDALGQLYNESGMKFAQTHVTPDPLISHSHESVKLTPRSQVESSVQNKGPSKFRPYGRNLDEIADRINQKAIENIKSQSESLEQEYYSEGRIVHMGRGGASVDPFSQFSSQGYQERQRRQVTPQYQVSVPLVGGQMPETIIIPETQVMKHEVPVTPLVYGQQTHEAQSNRRAVIIDGKKYRLNVAL